METNTRYSKDHYWVHKEKEKSLKIGLSSFAQSELGEIVYLELPIVGNKVNVGDVIGAIESLKSASELCAPVSGTITGSNKALSTENGMTLLNSDPQGAGWIFTMDMASKEDYFDLLSSEEYRRLTGTD